MCLLFNREKVNNLGLELSQFARNVYKLFTKAQRGIIIYILHLLYKTDIFVEFV